jgi:hypothetical protein
MTSSPSRLRRFWRALLLSLLVLLLLWGAMLVLLRPSNQRQWSPDQAELATAEIEGDEVRISNVRNALYRSTTDYDVRWEQRRYDLRQLESVWFMVEPFSDWRGPAHTLLSFGFSDGQYLAVSVEIRKEQGESFSPLKGLLRQYELTYIIGDERDLIGLRANHRRDEVFLYPVRTTLAGRRALLVSMLERANAVAAQPEFYNTLSNTCTTNIVEHIEEIVPGRIPFSYKTLLPGYSDELAFDLGLIDTALPRESFRAAHRINDLALEHADSAGFSAGIRARFEPR